MRSADLRRRTFEVTSRLRKIQGACSAASNDILNKQQLESMRNADRSEAIKQREWARFNQDLGEVTARLQTLYDAEHSKVVSLRNQLIKRTGTSKSDNANVNSSIDSGVASGVEPLNEIANYLDHLAERFHGRVALEWDLAGQQLV